MKKLVIGGASALAVGVVGTGIYLAGPASAGNTELTTASEQVAGQVAGEPMADQSQKPGKDGKNGKDGKDSRDGKSGVFSLTSAAGDNAHVRRGRDAHLRFVLKNKTTGALRGATVSADAPGAKASATRRVAPLKAGEGRSITLTLPVGRHASLGRHTVKVTMKVGGHAATETVTVRVTR